MPGASFHKGSSRQDYGTPQDLIDAVVARFGELDVDLAANILNAKAKRFYTEYDDSLQQDWTLLEGNLWLNPPFSSIAPWARKCFESRWQGGPWRRILLLVPASVGSVWYRDWVHMRCMVHFLCGRPSFDGKQPFPKDCMLCEYGPDAGFDVWNWRKR